MSEVIQSSSILGNFKNFFNNDVIKLNNALGLVYDGKGNPIGDVRSHFNTLFQPAKSTPRKVVGKPVGKTPIPPIPPKNPFDDIRDDLLTEMLEKTAVKVETITKAAASIIDDKKRNTQIDSEIDDEIKLAIRSLGIEPNKENIKTYKRLFFTLSGKPVEKKDEKVPGSKDLSGSKSRGRPAGSKSKTTVKILNDMSLSKIRTFLKNLDKKNTSELNKGELIDYILDVSKTVGITGVELTPFLSSSKGTKNEKIKKERQKFSVEVKKREDKRKGKK